MSVPIKLTVVGGKAGKRSVLLKPPTTIGRSKDANLTVAHPQVSRKHCELVESDGLILIRDVGSLNGTYVGSKRIKEAPLLPGATFSVGPLMFRIEYKFNGDRDRLPPTIPDERTLADEPSDEISKTLPVKNEKDSAQPEKQSADEDIDDNDDAALDDFLKGIT